MNVNELPDLPQNRRWRRQAQPAPIVVALITRQVDAGRQLLLIRRKSQTYGGVWALVGGKWDFGETLAQAITREAREETGLQTTLTAVRGLVSERLMPPQETDVAAHFLIFVCELNVIDGYAAEKMEGVVRWFSKTEIDTLHKETAILPSDYAMIQRFDGARAALPLVEAEMLGVIGRKGEQPVRLLRFDNHAPPPDVAE